jgi:hypothetical protein
VVFADLILVFGIVGAICQEFAGKIRVSGNSESTLALYC